MSLNDYAYWAREYRSFENPRHEEEMVSPNTVAYIPEVPKRPEKPTESYHFYLTDAKIKEIMLANGFKEKDQPNGSKDLNPYVYQAARALCSYILENA